ncbi:hypothetical protein QJQ45_004023 [Haematococcus lacustris]|nr:hypothetical protein QJQ45_004023 [Haematococcus lacustris]
MFVCVAECAGKPNFNLGDLLAAEAQKHSVALGRTMSSQQALGRLDYMKRGCQAAYAYHKALSPEDKATAQVWARDAESELQKAIKERDEAREPATQPGAIKRTAAALAGPLAGLQGPLLQEPLQRPQQQQPQQQQPQQLPLRVFAPGAGNQAEEVMSSAWSSQQGVAEHGLGVSWQGYMQGSLGGASGGSPLAPITPGASLSQGYVPGTQVDFAYIEKHLFPSNPSSEV